MKLVKLVVPSRTAHRSIVNAKRFVPFSAISFLRNARLVPLGLLPWFIFSESYAAECQRSVHHPDHMNGLAVSV